MNTTAINFTPRELDVLPLMVEGMTDKEIAARLGISHNTAYLHTAHLLKKTGLRNRTQLAVWAVRNLQLEVA